MPRLRSPLLVLLVTVAGCTGTGPTSNEEATDALKATLLHQQFVSYRNIQRYPGDVVCGEYESLDPWGSGQGYGPFVVVRGNPYKHPSATDVAIFCSDDAATALLSELGIGPLDDTKTELEQISADLEEIGVALEAFEVDYRGYPSTADGLQRLGDTGYLDAVPTDPWGRPYRYSSDSLGGAKGQYELGTLGADDAEGGSGADADIRVDYLRYLDHVSAL